MSDGQGRDGERPRRPSALSPALVEFLHHNRDAYTREALTQQLIEAGHDPAAIEAAWVAVDASSGGPSSSGSLGVDLLAALVMTAILLAYGGAILLALLGALIGASGSMYGAHPVVMLAYVAALAVVGFIAMRGLLTRVPNARSRLLTVLGIAVAAAVAFAGLSGLCVVALEAVP